MWSKLRPLAGIAHKLGDGAECPKAPLRLGIGDLGGQDVGNNARPQAVTDRRLHTGRSEAAEGVTLILASSMCAQAALLTARCGSARHHSVHPALTVKLDEFDIVGTGGSKLRSVNRIASQSHCPSLALRTSMRAGCPLSSLSALDRRSCSFGML